MSTPLYNTRRTGFTPYYPYPTPTGYSPYQAYPSTYIPPQTSAQTPIQQNLQTMIPQSNIIWVDNAEQINSYPTGRGWQQWFGLKDAQVLYVRETDMNGIQQPLQRVVYQLDPDTDPALAQAQTNDRQAAPQATDAVSREEFNKLTEAVNLMTDKLADLLK